MKWIKKLPLCFSYLFGLPSGGVPLQSTTSLMVRFENARVVVSTSGCSFNARTEGIGTTCTRSSAGKSAINFGIAWPTIPNCTASPEGESSSNLWLVPTTTGVTVNTFDYVVNLGAIGKTYGDQNYAIRCSGTQQ